MLVCDRSVKKELGLWLDIAHFPQVEIIAGNASSLIISLESFEVADEFAGIISNGGDIESLILASDRQEYLSPMILQILDYCEYLLLARLVVTLKERFPYQVAVATFLIVVKSRPFVHQSDGVVHIREDNGKGQGIEYQS